MTYLLPAFVGMPEVNRVYCIDALALLRAMPDNSVDTVISDIPYGVEYQSWDLTPRQEWLDECLRVASGAVVFFGASTTYAMRSMINLTPTADRILVWCPRFTLTKTALNNMYYRYHPIYVWRIPEKQTELYADVITTPTDGHNWWYHPATKPVKVMRQLVTAFCPVGGLILDPFAGSGSTLVAAQELSRRYIGCDVSPEYCEIARRRLAQPYTPNMFDTLLVKEAL